MQAPSTLSNDEFTHSQAREVLRCWRVSPHEPVIDLVPGRLFRVGGHRVLKCVEPRPVWHVALEFDVLRHLEACGVPVAVPQVARDGQTFVEQAGRQFILMPMIPGCDSAASAQERLRSCGSPFARLHAGLARYRNDTLTERLWRNEPLKELTDLRLPALRSAFGHQGRARFGALERVVENEVAADVIALPEQLIHRDLHSANVVFSGAEVAGILDWDHLSLGSIMIDLAYFLVNCALITYHDQAATPSVPGGGPPASWFGAVRPLLTAYCGVRALSDAESGALASLMIWSVLILADEHRQRGEPQLMLTYLDLLDGVLQERQNIRDTSLAVAAATPDYN